VRVAVTPDRVQEGDGLPPVHLRPERLEARIVEWLVADAAAGAHAEQTQVVQAARQLAKRGIDIGQRHRRERGVASTELLDDLGQAVVGDPRGFGR
jgi:hypothetical protein